MASTCALLALTMVLALLLPVPVAPQPSPGSYDTHITYGGILGSGFVPVENDNEAIVAAAKFSIVCLQSAGWDIFFAPRISLASKHILKHTRDSATPSVIQFRDQMGRLQRRAVILGVTYYFNLEWQAPHPDEYITIVTHIHHVAVTRDRNSAMALLHHTVEILHDDDTVSTVSEHTKHVVYEGGVWLGGLHPVQCPHLAPRYIVLILILHTLFILNAPFLPVLGWSTRWAPISALRRPTHATWRSMMLASVPAPPPPCPSPHQLTEDP